MLKNNSNYSIFNAYLFTGEVLLQNSTTILNPKPGKLVITFDSVNKNDQENICADCSNSVEAKQATKRTARSVFQGLNDAGFGPAGGWGQWGINLAKNIVTNVFSYLQNAGI